jgi:hypothetical protein
VQRVWNPADLPVRLEQRINSLSRDAVWRAYTDGARLWCAIGAAAHSSSCEPSAVALRVLFFGDDGEFCSGGIWTCVPDGEWRLEQVIDTSSGTRHDFDARDFPMPSLQLVRKDRHG